MPDMLFDSVQYTISSSLPQARQDELSECLGANGAMKVPLDEATHIISDSPRFEGWSAVKEGVYVVSDLWVDRSMVLGKQQEPRLYSPDPAMIFSGVVACTTDLDPSDNEVIAAAIAALGGLFRQGLTRDCTHLLAPRPGSAKYSAALHHQSSTRIRVVLPQWFDVCFKTMTRVDEGPYEWPNPEVLRSGPDAGQGDGDGKKKGSLPFERRAMIHTALASDSPTSPVPIPGVRPAKEPSSSPLKNSTVGPGAGNDVWQGRRILLSASLALDPGRRTAVEVAISRAGGAVVTPAGLAQKNGVKSVSGLDVRNPEEDWELHGDVEEERRMDEVDIFVTRFRTGKAYVKALRSGKTVGTLAWLFHVHKVGTIVRPQDKLLHYPVPRSPIENFDKHIITITNYTGEARDYLKKLIMLMGATFTPSMTAKNTVVIAAFIGGSKTEKAREWQIPIVHHTWLEDCFVAWKMLTCAQERYVTYPPGVDFAKLVGGRGLTGSEWTRDLEREIAEAEKESKKRNEEKAKRLALESFTKVRADVPNFTGKLDRNDSRLSSIPANSSPTKPTASPARAALPAPSNEHKRQDFSHLKLRTYSSAAFSAPDEKEAAEVEAVVGLADDYHADIGDTGDDFAVVEAPTADRKDADGDRTRSPARPVPTKVVTVSAGKGREVERLSPTRHNYVRKEEEEEEEEEEAEEEEQPKPRTRLRARPTPSNEKQKKGPQRRDAPPSVAKQKSIKRTARNEDVESEEEDEASEPVRPRTRSAASPSKVPSTVERATLASSSDDSTGNDDSPQGKAKLSISVSSNRKGKGRANVETISPRSNGKAKIADVARPSPTTKWAPLPQTLDSGSDIEGLSPLKPRGESQMAKAGQGTNDVDGNTIVVVAKVGPPRGAKKSITSSPSKSSVAIATPKAKLHTDTDEQRLRKRPSIGGPTPNKIVTVEVSTSPRDEVASVKRLGSTRSLGPSRSVVVVAADGLSSISTPKRGKPDERSRRESVTSGSSDEEKASAAGPSGYRAGLLRTPSRRSAASRANQRLHNEIMPDVLNFAKEMRSGAIKGSWEKSKGTADAKGKGRAASNADEVVEGGSKRRTSTARASSVGNVSDDENGVVRASKRRKLGQSGVEVKYVRRTEKAPRGKRSRSATSGDSEDDDAAPVGEKGTRRKSTSAELSPPAREVRLMTTQVELTDANLKSLAKLGVKLATRPSNCTHLLADHIGRTEKFLCAIPAAPYILVKAWALNSISAKKLLPEEDYLLQDSDNEKKFKFKLVDALRRAREAERKLLEGQTFYATPKVQDYVRLDLLKNVTASAGGKVVVQIPTMRILRGHDNRHVVSCVEDRACWRSLAEEGIPIYTQELLLMGVLTQRLEWGDHRVEGSQ